jgi:hypothetical protein
LIIGYLSFVLTLTAVIRWCRKRGKQARHKARMYSLLMLMRACASAVSRNEDHVSFAGLLLYHVTFLRRVKTWMEVEKHAVARACRSIGGIYHSWGYRSTLDYLDMTLRGCTKSSTWRGPVCLRSLRTWRVVVSFKGILIVLVLLLPWRMIAVWWRSYDTSLLHMVCICARWKPECSLLLGLHLGIASLGSCIRISIHTWCSICNS